ncbi:MAG: alpha/beta hydrolase [Candidatus Delongbacteria bacterium]|nr:alpha/beta hydrolase [Candidatus Delongbacteria bacterium]
MKKTKRRLFYIALVVFILMNIVSFFHAHKFTHYTDKRVTKTTEASKLTMTDKIKTLFFGINNPRPENYQFPKQDYDTVYIQSNKLISGWLTKKDNSIGTVIVFHGFSGEKSGMLDKSDIFLQLGFNTFLIDFMGSGASEGNQTTIGYYEAEEVKSSYDYISHLGETNIILYGTSMGAVAIIKAIHDYKINPKSIIIECPYSTMYRTVCNRFESMHLPEFPMAGLLTFWGGLQNGFWAYGMKPVEFAKGINCPTLLMYGELDNKVYRDEIDEIFANIQGPKKLILFPNAGHENYLNLNSDKWIMEVKLFLN